MIIFLSVSITKDVVRKQSSQRPGDYKVYRDLEIAEGLIQQRT